MNTDKILNKFTLWQPMSKFLSFDKLTEILSTNEEKSKVFVIFYNGEYHFLECYIDMPDDWKPVINKRVGITFFVKFFINKQFDCHEEFHNDMAWKHFKKFNFIDNLKLFISKYLHISVDEVKNLKFVWADELMNILYETLV